MRDNIDNTILIKDNLGNAYVIDFENFLIEEIMLESLSFIISKNLKIKEFA